MKTSFILFLLLIIVSSAFAQQNPVHWQCTAKRIGDRTYELHFMATIDSPWHIYARQNDPELVLPTNINIAYNDNIRLQDTLIESGRLESRKEHQTGEMINYYPEHVDFIQTVKLKTNSITRIKGSIDYMACTNERCLPQAKQSFNIVITPRAASAYDFKLKNSKGKTVNLSDFRGKVVVLDFWFTGCINCRNFYQNSLSVSERLFTHNSKVVFMSICIDKEKRTWLNSLEKGGYASMQAINLYTGGLGDQHPVLRQFNVSSYPQPIVINKRGEIVAGYHPVNSDSLAAKELANTIAGLLKE